ATVADGTSVTTGVGTTATVATTGAGTTANVAAVAAATSGGTGLNYVENLTAVADVATLMTAANTAFGGTSGTTEYYFGVIGTNGYLVHNVLTSDATHGADDIIQLTGVTDIAPTDIVA
ncbi:MAG: hypothetical protein PHC99_10395, partial [Methylococcales bacterium]|nr:hypothetical protein [Methylococcales bacterium]